MLRCLGVASSETYPCNPMYGYPSSCFAARSSRCFLQCLQHRQPCHSSASNMNPMQATHLQGLHVAPKPWWNNRSKMPVERDGNSKALGLSTRFCSTLVGFSVPVIAFVRGVRCKLHPESVITPASWGLELLEAESCPAADHHRSGVHYFKKKKRVV